MHDQNGSLRIVHGSNGDIGKLLLSRFIRWLPALAATAFIGYTTQWFISWREQAVTNRVLLDQADALKVHIQFADNNFVTKAEWIAAKNASDAKLVDGLESIRREMGYIANGQRSIVNSQASNSDKLTHATAILEKLPVPKEKR